MYVMCGFGNAPPSPLRTHGRNQTRTGVWCSGRALDVVQKPMRSGPLTAIGFKGFG